MYGGYPPPGYGGPSPPGWQPQMSSMFPPPPQGFRPPPPPQGYGPPPGYRGPPPPRPPGPPPYWPLRHQFQITITILLLYKGDVGGQDVDTQLHQLPHAKFFNNYSNINGIEERVLEVENRQTHNDNNDRGWATYFTNEPFNKPSSNTYFCFVDRSKYNWTLWRIAQQENNTALNELLNFSNNFTYFEWSYQSQ